MAAPLWLALAVFLLGWTTVVHWTTVRHRLDCDRNKLFRVRHELVMLVATKSVSPDDRAFGSLYELVNFLIANTQMFGMLAFLSEARRRKIPSQIRELLEEAHEKREAMRPVVHHFCATLRELLRSNRLLWWRIVLGSLLWQHSNELFPPFSTAAELDRICGEGVARLANPTAA